MNFVMRILFPTSMILLLTVATVVAQNTPRTSAGKTQTSIAPSSATKPRITTSAPKTIDRSSNAKPSAERSTTATTSSTERSSSSGSLRPSATSLRNTNIARPPSVANTQRQQTSKTIVKSNKKVAPIKVVEKVNVNWMTLEQAMEKSKLEKRKIFVDVYTDWCGWCKHMDSTTFVSPSVARYLNEHYYPVKLNAEQTQDIVFKDKTYHFKKTGSRGHHELAALWLNNRLSFPTVVFLDESQNLIQPVPGYQDATKMEAIINYFGSDSHRKVPWETYEKNFSSQEK